MATRHERGATTVVARAMSEPTIKLRFVRVHLGKNQLDVVVDDLVAKRPRFIKYKWGSRQKGDVPVGDWYDVVEREAL
jgi:hypothetical protein